MKTFIRIYLGLFIAMVIFILNGCATIVHGTKQSIPIATEPSGAQIVVDGTERHTSPMNVILSRKHDHMVEISKEGYQTETIQVKSVLSGAVAGNIIAGGVIGWGIDAASGGQWRLVPESINLRLRPEVTQAKAAPITEKEPSVEEKLDQLKKLKDKGKITEEEYAKMRSDVLSDAHRSKTISSSAPKTPGKYQTSPVSTQTSKKETLPPEPKETVKEPETKTVTKELQ